MHLKKALPILGLVLLLLFTVGSRSGLCDPVIPCENIKNLAFKDLAFNKPITNPSDPKTSGWAGWILPLPPAMKSRQLQYGETFIQYMAFYPNSKGPTYDWKTFNFDTDPLQQATIAALIDSVDPNIAAVKNKGAKIIHFHGWADPALTAFMSIDYYESVLKAMGDAETKSFYKLYLLPGVFHCAGGVGCDKDTRTLWLQPMIDWVEKGIEPQAIIGTKVDSSGAVVRTRPFCPYPEVARYKGTGSIDDAANFACVKADAMNK